MVSYIAIGLPGGWLGAIYAGGNVSKKYFTKSKENIAIKALTINLTISLGFVLTSKLFLATMPLISETSSSAMTSIGIYTITLSYLYFALRYIKVN